MVFCSRGSTSNSRTSSVTESVSIPTEGFSNYFDVIQHLQTGKNKQKSQMMCYFSILVWNNHQNIQENPSSRRTTHDETHYSKGHSSHQHHSHHQYWTNYNNHNPRRTQPSNYSRGYNHNDTYWNNSKSTRFTNHRSVNSLMNNNNNNNNYQQQQSPPVQRRPGDNQNSQTFYKNKSSHDRRVNGYHSSQQHTSDYSLNNHQETANISSTQSYPNNLNSYNR